MSENRKYDVVLYGATGFTGRLASIYLAQYPDKDINISWAIAGRSQKKLEDLKSELVGLNPSTESVPILIADCSSSSDLDVITSQSKCVVNFAGPYTKYGSEVVGSCVRNSCHYVDLTGELAWVKRMLKLHQETAVKNNVRLVPVCGFDSVPSDLSALLVTEKIRQDYQDDTAHVNGVFLGFKGGMSGGTLASMQEMHTPEYAAEYREMKNDPQFYNPDNSKSGKDELDLQYPRYLPDFKSWTSPFIMSPLNTRVVRRSNAINEYGSDFVYNEMVLNHSWMRAKSAAMMYNTMTGAIGYSAVRSLINRYGPQPGQGPDPKNYDKSFFKLRAIGKPSKHDNVRVVCDCEGKGDPGYQLTGRMMVEAGVCLALFPDEITPNRSGFLTPASGIGRYFATRLQKFSGFSFKVSVIEDAAAAASNSGA